MYCADCVFWITQRKTVYTDGSETVVYQSSSGLGHCSKLNQEVVEDFGCVMFQPGEHVSVTWKEGAPWQNFTMVPCPDCEGRGSTSSRACRRCSGTAKIRRYDDGYLADETWDHPREKERKKPPETDPGLILRPRESGRGGVMT